MVKEVEVNETKAAPLAQGTLPSAEYKDLAGLKFAISRPTAVSRSPDGGLIVPDQTRSVATPTQAVEFHADPREVLHGVLRYYRPQR